MEDELVMLQMVFGDQIEQTGDNQLQYKTDQLSVTFDFPDQYPEAPFTFKISQEIQSNLRTQLEQFTTSCMDFITFLSQNFSLTTETVSEKSKQQEGFKRAIFDTHAHFVPEFFDSEQQWQQKLDQFKAINDSKIIIIGSNPETSLKAFELAQQLNYYCTVGLHPHAVEQLYKEDPVLYYQNVEKKLADIALLLSKHSDMIGKYIVGIGECGISSIDEQIMRLQLKVLQKHLDLGLKYNLPVVIHAHRSSQLQLVVDLIFAQSQYRNSRLVIHGFSADIKQLESLQQVKSCYFSANLMLLKMSGNFKKAIRKLGTQRVLVETDSPFSPNETHAGPGDVVEVLKKLASEIEMNIDELNKIVNQNAKDCFGITE